MPGQTATAVLGCLHVWSNPPCNRSIHVALSMPAGCTSAHQTPPGARMHHRTQCKWQLPSKRMPCQASETRKQSLSAYMHYALRLDAAKFKMTLKQP